MEVIRDSESYMERASRGFIRNWYSSGQPTTDKPSLDTVFDVVKNEPTVKSAARAIVDELLKNGYRIKSTNLRLKKTVETELSKKYRFSRLLKKLVWNLILYQNVFLEIVYKENNPEELHVLETAEMEIVSDEHGEIIAYRQNHGDKKADFTPDEVVHISMDNISSNLWGEVDLKTLYKTIALKQYIENFLVYQFRYDKFRDIWMMEGGDEIQIKGFLDTLKQARDHPEKDIVIEGTIQKILGKDIKDIDKLVELLNYCRQQILVLLRVPAIIAGIPDNSNRSNSEVQSKKSFDGRIKSIQEDLAEELTFELFPKMGWKQAEFEFPPLDKRAEKDDIEIIVALKNIGLDEDSLLQYIRDVGIELPEGAYIKEGTVGANPFPESRKPEDKSAPVKHETGSDSTTREEQLVGRSLYFEEGIDQFEEEVLKKKKWD